MTEMRIQRNGFRRIQAMFSSKNFSKFPVTLNFWTHVWSIKYSLKNNQLHNLVVNDEMNLLSLISPWLDTSYQMKRMCYSSQNQKISRTKHALKHTWSSSKQNYHDRNILWLGCFNTTKYEMHAPNWNWLKCKSSRQTEINKKYGIY